MDGLRPVFNEGSRYLRLRYVSFPYFIDNGKLTTTEFCQEDHLIDELLSRFFEFNHVHTLDIWLGEAEFNVTMKGDFSLGSLTFGSSRILSGHPPSDQWILRSKEPVSNHVDSRLDKSFQILAASWIIGQSITDLNLHEYEAPGLRYAQSVAGSKLLQCLEKNLSSSSLSKLGADKLTALIRILLVTLSLVMSSRKRCHSSLVSLLR